MKHDRVAKNKYEKFNELRNKHAKSVSFNLGHETIERVKIYNYLRQVVSADPNHDWKQWATFSTIET